MEIEDRLKVLEDEFPRERDQIRRILLDMRAFFMEAHTPLRVESGMGRTPSQIRSEKRMEQDGDQEEG